MMSHIQAPMADFQNIMKENQEPVISNFQDKLFSMKL
jgi:hypothetical protein